MDSLKLDVEELKTLLASATRPAVKKFLEEKMNSLVEVIKQAEKPAEQPTVEAAPKTASGSSSLLPTVKLSGYAWDQSDKFVKIYLPLKGIQNLDSANVETTFTPRSFDVLVRNLNGTNYTITMKDLLEEIDAEASLVKQKTDDLLVMLKKKSSKKWDEITRAAYMEKEKKKPKFDAGGEGGDPQDSLMTMMKQMYEDGDDEMKRSIRKAWHEGQAKKSGPEF